MTEGRLSMTISKPSKREKPALTQYQAEKQKRLSEALRQNLKKRKEQVRGRASLEKEQKSEA